MASYGQSYERVSIWVKVLQSFDHSLFVIFINDPIHTQPIRLKSSSNFYFFQNLKGIDHKVTEVSAFLIP